MNELVGYYYSLYNWHRRLAHKPGTPR